jgi:predicted dinucleotide-binding enzyme
MPEYDAKASGALAGIVRCRTHCASAEGVAMVIAVLGTGGVGRTLAAKLRELGHEVRLGTRDPMATRARAAEGSLGPWLEQHADVPLFLSGDDAEAKERVRELLASFGWRDILDLGDITTSRGPEMYLPLWLRLYGHFGTSLVSTKVVR